jgi:hypothetical protein
VERVRDEPRLEPALQLGVGTGKFIQSAGEDGVRVVSAEEEEELPTQLERRLCSPDGILDQRVCFLQVFDGCLAAQEHLGIAELEKQFGALRRGGRLSERAAEVSDGALGGTPRPRAPRRPAQRGTTCESAAGGASNRCAATRSDSTPALARRRAARPCPISRSTGASVS